MKPISCRPIGWVVREEPVREEYPRGYRNVISYNEELMSKRARIVVDARYCRGLQGVRPGMLLWIIWYAHKAPSGDKAPLVVKPFMDDSMPERGVFLTRSPARPCPLGLSLVYVEEVDECSIVVRGLDAFDSTPVLDIKVYSDGLDSASEVLRRARTVRGSTATS